jgi:hypothetical protein
MAIDDAMHRMAVAVVPLQLYYEAMVVQMAVVQCRHDAVASLANMDLHLIE